MFSFAARDRHGCWVLARVQFDRRPGGIIRSPSVGSSLLGCQLRQLVRVADAARVDLTYVQALPGRFRAYPGRAIGKCHVDVPDFGSWRGIAPDERGRCDFGRKNRAIFWIVDCDPGQLRVDSHCIALPRQCQASLQQRCGQDAGVPERVSPGSQRNPILTRKTIRPRNGSTVCHPFRASCVGSPTRRYPSRCRGTACRPRISAGPDAGRASPTPTPGGSRYERWLHRA